tara:strand:- start:3584 stop:5065 length:1482 start_codon:yes stop_codon:yes gene_type:complete
MEKLLIYVVTFNHEKFIKKTIERIDQKIFKNFDTEILVNDDSSTDNTLEILKKFKSELSGKVKFNILSNPKNLGYGGNQKIGYHYAIKNNFDYVALLHGDGQYAPEILSDLLSSFKIKNVKAVFGTRMLKRFDAIKGGMPLYKFFGNKILTYLQNKILKSKMSEFHSGYRIYKVNALNEIPFHLNSNDYTFDTEIIIQFLISNFKIKEIPIPTFYGEEISYVNGFYYAYRIINESLKAKIQTLGIFYDKKYDLIKDENNYKFKKNFTSTHSLTFQMIKENSYVLDLGCNDGEMIRFLENKKNCRTVGIDVNTSKPKKIEGEYHPCNLDGDLPNIKFDDFDFIVFLDVIEHLKSPENFMSKLYAKLINNEKVQIIISTPNISFIIMRIMLLFGFFNYGKRGILDKSHTRLFTFSSFKKLIENSNFSIVETRGVPAPYPLAVGENFIGKFLISLNNFFIRLWKSMFAYQIICRIKPNKSLDMLLSKAKIKYKQVN